MAVSFALENLGKAPRAPLGKQDQGPRGGSKEGPEGGKGREGKGARGPYPEEAWGRPPGDNLPAGENSADTLQGVFSFRDDAGRACLAKNVDRVDPFLENKRRFFRLGRC